MQEKTFEIEFEYQGKGYNAIVEYNDLERKYRVAQGNANFLDFLADNDPLEFWYDSTINKYRFHWTGDTDLKSRIGQAILDHESDGGSGSHA